MTIQSPTPAITRAPALLQAARTYEAAKTKFAATAEVQDEKAESYEKWGLRASFGVGLGAVVGGAVLWTRHVGPIASYASAFPAVLLGFAAGAAVYHASHKLAERALSGTDFLQDRTAVVAARDQYRASLLAELNDQGVSDITNPRWNELKQEEDQGSVTPTRAEIGLLREVDQLALLAGSRLKSGWESRLAELQDDPARFEAELGMVRENDGLLRAMVEGHGQSS